MGDMLGELGLLWLLVLALLVALEPTPILLLLVLRLLGLRLPSTMTRGTSLRICEGSVFCFRGTGQWASASPRSKPLVLALRLMRLYSTTPPTKSKTGPMKARAASPTIEALMAMINAKERLSEGSTKNDLLSRRCLPIVSVSSHNALPIGCFGCKRFCCGQGGLV
jgi:hypothetical protein